jgi:hypothetical protein
VHQFVLLQQTHCRFGKPFLRLLLEAGMVAASHSDEAFTCNEFVTNALLELAVSLFLRNARMEQIVTGFHPQVSSSSFVYGLMYLSADLVVDL